MECISVVLSPLCPNISTTLPIGFLACSGHSVIFTTALSPLLPPFNAFLGINMSLANVRSSVSRKAKSLRTSNFPTNDLSFLSRISTTCASRTWCFLRANKVTFTLSPPMACKEFRSATRTGSPPSNGVTVFLPFALRLNMASNTCPVVFKRKCSFSVSFI